MPRLELFPMTWCLEVQGPPESGWGANALTLPWHQDPGEGPDRAARRAEPPGAGVRGNRLCRSLVKATLLHTWAFRQAELQPLV